jgi:hypothetical protein
MGCSKKTALPNLRPRERERVHHSILGYYFVGKLIEELMSYGSQEREREREGRKEGRGEGGEGANLGYIRREEARECVRTLCSSSFFWLWRYHETRAIDSMCS